MKDKIFNLKIGNTDGFIIFFGVGLFLVGLVLMAISIIAALIFLVLGLAVATYNRGVEIDIKNKEYKEYESMLWIPKGSWENYNEVEKMFINKVWVSRKMSSARANQKFTQKGNVYKGFVKFDGERKVLVIENKRMNKVIDKLKEINREFNVDIEDYSV
ncbi:MAG: phage holin family protein [Cyclobacteriaceae bacterium]|nr:phage holin family protein [Cyclobacteriaceae bacterium]